MPNSSFEPNSEDVETSARDAEKAKLHRDLSAQHPVIWDESEVFPNKQSPLNDF